VVQRHDENVRHLLEAQITDPKSLGRGIVADQYGLHNPGTAAGIIDAFLTAYVQPKSKYHRDAALPERIQLAADFLTRVQSPDGNINLLSTNSTRLPTRDSSYEHSAHPSRSRSAPARKNWSA
jgi:hypothetical protein